MRLVMRMMRVMISATMMMAMLLLVIGNVDNDEGVDGDDDGGNGDHVDDACQYGVDCYEDDDSPRHHHHHHRHHNHDHRCHCHDFVRLSMRLRTYSLLMVWLLSVVHTCFKIMDFNDFDEIHYFYEFPDGLL